MPTISVIMPNYNKARYIKRSIESVLNQSYKDFELIIIDDESTDNSIEIIEYYLLCDNRIKLHKQNNKGVSGARNSGIDLSVGLYVSFLDADDEWYPDFLNEMLLSIENGNVCYCAHFYKREKDLIKAKIKFQSGDILENYLKNICTPNTNSWLIKKSFVNDYNIRFMTGINWGEDMMFFSEILMRDKNIKCSQNYLTIYNLNIEDNLSQNLLSKIDLDIYWMMQIIDKMNEIKVNVQKQESILKVIFGYRMPAAIIYRIYNNLKVVDKYEVIVLLKKYSIQLERINLINGFRSIKVICIYFIIKSALICRK